MGNMMKKLFDVSAINPHELVFAWSPSVEAIFDGDVMLERSCYKIDEVGLRLQLLHPPAFKLRALHQVA